MSGQIETYNGNDLSMTSNKIGWTRSCLLFAVLCALLVVSACGGGGSSSSTSTPPANNPQAATPTITAAAPTSTAITTATGAQIVTLADSTSGASIYYTLDGSTPTSNSTLYAAPFIVTSSLTVKAIATASGNNASDVASQSFAMTIPSGTLVWSDEFANATGSNIAPDKTIWTYDTGGNQPNSEQEVYCSAGSSASPCDPNNPNVYVASDGLHITARNPSNGVFTSGRMKTEGLFSFTYGRLEAKIKLPKGQAGIWPAFWLLGNDINTVSWPGCGELDIMEHIDAPSPDWIQGSVHGPTSAGSSSAYENVWGQYSLPSGTNFSDDFHTFGMILTKGQVQFYVDSPTNGIYETATPSQTPVWPFDTNGGSFIILNQAVGGAGSWGGAPTASTTFPSDMVVGYVRLYTN